MSWLVTGGAGYIGAHVVAAMCEAGERVVVVDDLSTGDRTRIAGVPFVEGSVLDRPLLERTMREHAVTGVVRIAAKKQVEESVRRPLHYYRENVEGLRRLLEAVTAAGVGSFVFSSSAAVYGAPDVAVVREDTECRPVNPYGQTKLTGEHMVSDVARAIGMRYASLRYFNVAGAARPELADTGEGNLVPRVFRRVSEHQAPIIFGDDFPTRVGTCVRDFVHVADIASAHVASARALGAGSLHALTANVGRGDWVSVREMIGAIREVTGTADDAWAEPEIAPRRAGDPPASGPSRRPSGRTSGGRPNTDCRKWFPPPGPDGGPGSIRWKHRRAADARFPCRRVRLICLPRSPSRTHPEVPEGTLRGSGPAPPGGGSRQFRLLTPTSPTSRRPLNSVLDLAKVTAAGFAPRGRRTALAGYLDRLARWGSRVPWVGWDATRDIK